MSEQKPCLFCGERLVPLENGNWWECGSMTVEDGSIVRSKKCMEAQIESLTELLEQFRVLEAEFVKFAASVNLGKLDLLQKLEILFADQRRLNFLVDELERTPPLYELNVIAEYVLSTKPYRKPEGKMVSEKMTLREFLDEKMKQ